MSHFLGKSLSAFLLLAITSIATAAPPVPTLYNPANGSTGLSTTSVSFSWYSSGATNYRIVISQNSAFSGFTDANGSSTCDGTCYTAATSSTSLTKGMDLSGRTYYWKVRANNSTGASAWSITRSFTTAGTAARLVFPFSSGQRWYICQGYNGYVSHTSNLIDSLDLSVSSASVGSTGCTSSTAYSSQNYSVVSPDNGAVAWIGSTQPDIMCINLDSGGSIKLGHFYSAVSSGARVTRNQYIGKLSAPGVGTNGGYSHIHMQLFNGSGCVTTNHTAFGTAFGSPNLSYNGTRNQWAGTSLSK